MVEAANRVISNGREACEPSATLERRLWNTSSCRTAAPLTHCDCKATGERQCASSPRCPALLALRASTGAPLVRSPVALPVAAAAPVHPPPPPPPSPSPYPLIIVGAAVDGRGGGGVGTNAFPAGRSVCAPLSSASSSRVTVVVVAVVVGVVSCGGRLGGGRAVSGMATAIDDMGVVEGAALAGRVAGSDTLRTGGSGESDVR